MQEVSAVQEVALSSRDWHLSHGLEDGGARFYARWHSDGWILGVHVLRSGRVFASVSHPDVSQPRQVGGSDQFFTSVAVAQAAADAEYCAIVAGKIDPNTGAVL